MHDEVRAHPGEYRVRGLRHRSGKIEKEPGFQRSRSTTTLEISLGTFSDPGNGDRSAPPETVRLPSES